MKTIKKKIIALLSVVVIITAGSVAYYQFVYVNDNDIGKVIDHFNGVNVYYNGQTGHVSGRNLAPDGYNLGQKYQCVEFIKRYYYERFNHKMPDSCGHAKDFFNTKIPDGQINPQRNLLQFPNGSQTKPQEEDIIVLGGNRYGHIAIISKVTNDNIEIVQQNPGPRGKSRVTYPLINKEGSWIIDNRRVLGYLRIVIPKA